MERQDRWGTGKAIDGPAAYSTPWVAKRLAGNSLTSHGPAIGPDGFAYYGTWVENRINKIDLGTMNLAPEFFSTLSFNVSTPALGNNGQLYTSSGPRLFSINPTIMDYDWFLNINNTSASDSEGSSPIIGPDGDVICVSSNGRVWRLNPQTGAVIWMRQLQECRRTPCFTRDDTKLLIADAGNLRALNYADGTTAWTKAADGYCGAPGAAPNGTIVFGSENGTIFGVNPTTGLEIWRFVPFGKSITAPAFDGDFAYLTCNDTRLYKFDVNTGTRIWSFQTGTGQNNPAPPSVGFDGRIYFEGRVGHFYCVNPNGTLNWTTNFPNDPRGSLTIDKQGTLFIPSGEVFIIRQTPAHFEGQVIFNDLNSPESAPTLVVLELRAGSSTTTIVSKTAVLDATGHFSVDMTPPFNLNGPSANGNYTLSVKKTHWLRRTLPVNLGSGSATGLVFSLINGDASGDNDIDIGDYALLSSSYGKSLGDPGFSVNADFNGDDSVDIGDYAILSQNYGLFGNP